MQFTGGSGGNGLAPNVTGVRFMDPVTSGRYPKPYGYYSYMGPADASYGAADPHTGRPLAQSDPGWHRLPGGPVVTQSAIPLLDAASRVALPIALVALLASSSGASEESASNFLPITDYAANQGYDGFFPMTVSASLDVASQVTPLRIGIDGTISLIRFPVYSNPNLWRPGPGSTMLNGPFEPMSDCEKQKWLELQSLLLEGGK